MGKSREIKTRIKAVKNIQRITRTMQMIATSKFARAQQAATSSKPYTEGLFDLVAQLASAAGDIEHPLLDSTDASKPELTLVIASDRGLCGPYNGNIIRTALNHIKGNEAAMAGPVEVVGKKGLTPLRFNGIEVSRHHTQFGDKPRYEDVDALAERYMSMFATGEISAVRVVSMKYYSAGKQSPVVARVLPFESESVVADDDGETAGPVAAYEFTPDAEELLGALLPAAVKAVLFQIFNDAIVSEHVGRMIAMKAATDNAGSMGKALKTKFNRARQAQITTELTEIVSGAAALG
jgi:F-type H+-transporting ATPase subunit gamma